MTAVVAAAAVGGSIGGDGGGDGDGSSGGVDGGDDGSGIGGGDGGVGGDHSDSGGAAAAAAARKESAAVVAAVAAEEGAAAATGAAMETAAETAVGAKKMTVPPCMSSRIIPALVRQHAGSTQGSTGRQRASTGAQGGRRGRTELKGAADHLLSRTASLEATTARIGGRLRAQAKQQRRGNEPNPPVGPWLKSSKGGHFTFTVTTG